MAIAKKITTYLRDRIANQEDPRLFAKPLRNEKSGLWRYPVENYRIICEFQEDELIVLVIRIGHRKNIYDE